jgi:hypothetical protein
MNIVNEVGASCVAGQRGTLPWYDPVLSWFRHTVGQWCKVVRINQQGRDTEL